MTELFAGPSTVQMRLATGKPIAGTFTQLADQDAFTQSGTGAVIRSINSKIGDVISAADFGAIADGVTDNTTALNSFAAVAGLHILKEGDYAALGAVASLASPDIIIAAADTTIKGGRGPIFSIPGNVSLDGMPDNYVFIRQNVAARNSEATVRIDRVVDADSGLFNPKALQVHTNVNTDTATTEWAISGELDQRSNTISTGNVAVSGVANQYASGTVFGGHFQAKEWVIETVTTDVNPLVGVEINTPAVGLDSPTANNNIGNRYGIDLIARTNENIPNWDTAGGNDGDAEIGCGIRIKNDGITEGYYRYGLVIDDVTQTSNTNPITTAALIRTSGPDGLVIAGANTATAMRINPATTGNHGLILEGTYITAAIRVDTGNFISLSTDDSRKIRYNGGSDAFEISNGASERFSVRLTSAPMIELNDVQVLQERITGYTNAMTGTADRATSYATSTITLQQLAERVKAIQDDLTTHGMIGI